MLRNLGDYLILMWQTFSKPDKALVFRKRLLHEFYNLGFTSIIIVLILSVFVGAVATILVAYNTDNPLLPEKLIGFSARQMIILEFSPTMISLILAGKQGSQIASELGTMRVTQQIDALKVMGVNPANYLILPKIIQQKHRYTTTERDQRQRENDPDRNPSSLAFLSLRGLGCVRNIKAAQLFLLHRLFRHRLHIGAVVNPIEFHHAVLHYVFCL